MLTLQEIVENLPIHLCHGANGWKDVKIKKIVAGDLMSDILVSIDADTLLITSLATEQAIRTADIVCAAAVLLVNDKLPTLAMKDLAEDSNITLMCSPFPMFETCANLTNLEFSLKLKR
ncbi:MAG: hypothetical protein GX220_06825 [Treponema sp.]|jgi:molybdopterin-binding protein|nr:hypothetical protein [Treponema sp.]